MRIRTFLLGSAAAFAVVGGAQAADLSVAEPISYVKVCDAFGAGYFYIPGGDTCLKLSGYVRVNIDLHSNANVYAGGTHSSTWDTDSRGFLGVDVSSMTELGELDGSFAFQSDFGTGTQTNTANLDHAYLKLGPFLAGMTETTFGYGGPFTFNGTQTDTTTVNQVRLSWAMSGFGIMVAAEDPRTLWGTSLPSTYSMPDLIAAVTMAQSKWDGKLAFGVTQGGSGGGATSTTGFGINGGLTFKLDQIAAGDRFRIQGAWASNAGKFVGPGAITTAPNAWSVLASFQHFWAPTLSTAVAASYLSETAGPTGILGLNGNLVWSPVTNFHAGIEADYSKASGTTGVVSGLIRLERDF